MIEDLASGQKQFFESQQTKDVRLRKKYLKILKQEIIDCEAAICDALYNDFKKPEFEALATETQFVLSELSYLIKNVSAWSRPVEARSSLANFPSSDWVYHEPYGNVLVISPWNYPFMLSMVPLIGAVAAGNTVVLKPSELAPNTSKVLSEIITKVFPKEYVSVVEGGIEASQTLLAQKWDYIFFTGSSRVGKIIYKSAAEHLTPVTLELGGKNPCIVDETASIKLAAKRIAWGKFLNGGQTCVAPDYILAHTSVKQEFVEALQQHIKSFYGDSMEKSPDLARIVTESHFSKLKKKLEGQKILFGGKCVDSERFIEPTLVDEPNIKSELMQEEIFGPILPILSYTETKELHDHIARYEKPLSLYIFSKNKKFRKTIIEGTSFGGGVINDVVMQIANKNLPFGGVGQSGIGACHGKYSFELFSHKKAIIKKGNWLDIPIRYAPYKLPIKLVKLLRHLM